jgi:bis(5'-nucleosyl)-tetraphosphatase (symmetrical)
MALLDKINFDYEQDKLYLTGDLINKGPKAFEVVDFLLKHPKILSVK